MAFGGQDVFSSITAQINAGDHIGLVGPNGAGKTTLLRLLINQLQPIDGHVAVLPALTIGYLPQNPEYPKNQTVFNEVYSGLGEIKRVESEMNRLEKEIREADEAHNVDLVEKSGMKYAEYADLYQSLGGAATEARIAALLDGLGVPKSLWHSRMDSLSGGERNMVGLAKILVGDHDLLLLDEPGNHLDFSGLEWLENFLRKSPKAFIIVSHSRYTLDRVCTSIWELMRCKMELFTGNYSDYRHEKLTRELAQGSAYKRAQKDIARLNFNIQRLKAWSSVYGNAKLARTAKQFERRVEELEKVDKPQGDGKAVRFRFLAQPPRGHIALEVKNYHKQFPGRPVLIEDASFLVTQGERVALVGDNGTGKSTLVKEVIEKGRWEDEVLRVGKSVNIGYYSQLGENLEPMNTITDEIVRLTGLQYGNATDLLHRFLFTRDDLEKQVRVLSGGEKARLQLAALVTSEATMLLLDEPTNHLDIASREAVEDALEEYPGTLIIVSHDRYFLDKLADRIFHFSPPEVIEYDGNFSEYWDKRKIALVASGQKLHQGMFGRMVSPDKIESKDTPAIKIKKIKFNPQRFAELEAEIKRLEDIRPQVEEEFKTLNAKGKIARAAKRSERLEKLDHQLEGLYEEWLVLGEKKKKW